MRRRGGRGGGAPFAAPKEPAAARAVKEDPAAAALEGPSNASQRSDAAVAARGLLAWVFSLLSRPEPSSEEG